MKHLFRFIAVILAALMVGCSDGEVNNENIGEDGEASEVNNYNETESSNKVNNLTSLIHQYLYEDSEISYEEIEAAIIRANKENYINSYDEFNEESPLETLLDHYGLTEKAVRVLDLLIKNNADLNAYRGELNTPIVAIGYNQTDEKEGVVVKNKLISMMLENGADPNIIVTYQIMEADDGSIFVDRRSAIDNFVYDYNIESLKLFLPYITSVELIDFALDIIEVEADEYVKNTRNMLNEKRTELITK